MGTDPSHTDASHTDASHTAKRPVFLYACVHNSGRSVAAKVLTEHYGKGAVLVLSGGSEPADALNPEIVAVLEERGLSASSESPKLLTAELAEGADVVVTMGCGETCPVFPGKRYLDWEIDDPAGKDRETARKVVDLIDSKVRALLKEMGVKPGTDSVA